MQDEVAMATFKILIQGLVAAQDMVWAVANGQARTELLQTAEQLVGHIHRSLKELTKRHPYGP